MFIRTKEFNALLNKVDEIKEEVLASKNVLESYKTDLDNLRKQNKDLRTSNIVLLENRELLAKSINELIEKLKTKADVEFKVVDATERCDLCKHEFKNCKKLSVGDTTVCVVPKIPFPDE